MNIFTIGERRFRLVTLNTTQPYLRGEVALLDQQPTTDSAQGLLPKAQLLFDEYLKTYLALADQWTRGVYLPKDAADAGDYIAARLDIGASLKQELLEQLSPEERLRAGADDHLGGAARHARAPGRAPAPEDVRFRRAELMAERAPLYAIATTDARPRPC